MKLPSIAPTQDEWHWKEWSHTAPRIQIAPLHIASSGIVDPQWTLDRTAWLALKTESLALAAWWKERFAPSTYNSGLDGVSPSEFFTRMIAPIYLSALLAVIWLDHVQTNRQGGLQENAILP